MSTSSHDCIHSIISFPAEGEACLDVMADLAAMSGENNMELISVSSDSIPVHRLVGWLLSMSSCFLKGLEGEEGEWRPHGHAG